MPLPSAATLVSATLAAATTVAATSLVATSVAAAPVAATGSAAASPDALDALRWHARALVIAAPTPDDARAAGQRRIFAAGRAGAGERDLVLLEATGDEAAALALRRRFGVGPGEFRAILVGKDGGAKLASPEPIAAERLFATIDAMPMRRDEMRRRAP